MGSLAVDVAVRIGDFQHLPKLVSSFGFLCSGRNVDELTRRYIDAVDFIAGRPPRPIESADQLERSLEELDWRIHAKQAGKAAHGTIGDMVDAQIVKEQTFVVAKAQG